MTTGWSVSPGRCRCGCRASGPGCGPGCHRRCGEPASSRSMTAARFCSIWPSCRSWAPRRSRPPGLGAPGPGGRAGALHADGVAGAGRGRRAAAEPPQRGGDRVPGALVGVAGRRPRRVAVADRGRTTADRGHGGGHGRLDRSPPRRRKTPNRLIGPGSVSARTWPCSPGCRAATCTGCWSAWTGRDSPISCSNTSPPAAASGAGPGSSRSAGRVPTPR